MIFESFEVRKSWKEKKRKMGSEGLEMTQVCERVIGREKKRKIRRRKERKERKEREFWEKRNGQNKKKREENALKRREKQRETKPKT